MGTFFELGKDKAVKREGWAQPIISHQLCPRYSGAVNPPPPTGLWESFTFFTLVAESAYIVYKGV